MIKHQSGFSLIELIVSLVIVSGIGTAVYLAVATAGNASANPLSTISPLFGSPMPHSDVRWNADSRGGWQVVAGTAPACPTGPMMQSPVGVGEITSVFYPGQNRGGYKTYGGFRFDDADLNHVTVKAPMDGYVYRAARYEEGGLTQYMLDVINPCGVMYRLDHLTELNDSLTKMADVLPLGSAAPFAPGLVDDYVTVRAGDVLATRVGYVKGTSIASFDFGVYDLRSANAVAQQPGYVQTYGAEMAGHAVCWLKGWLPTADETELQALPAGDPIAGARSDYCK